MERVRCTVISIFSKCLILWPKEKGSESRSQETLSILNHLSTNLQKAAKTPRVTDKEAFDF
jgi:hypothetical protein